MKLPTSLLSTGLLLAAAAGTSNAASSGERKANVFIQPIRPGSGSAVPAPHLLAEIQYDPFITSTADAVEILSYEAPEFDEDEDEDEADDHTSSSSSSSISKKKLLRVGVYDPSTKTWASSTSVASAENFSKGYSPQILLSVDARTGEVVGAALKGVRIDAGQTRDFGPKAVLRVDSPGKQPDLNKPVVLAPNGKKVEPEPEKTMLQKYWWVLAIGLFLAMSGGGEPGK